jgi:hypothetical protein
MKRFSLVAGGIGIALVPILGGATAGQTYRVNFTDIDGKALSTAEGRITTVVLVSKENVDKAHEVGDRVPDFCLGNPGYRMITVVTFEAKHIRPVRNFMTSVMRRRVDSRAKQLQARYDQLKIARNARQDIWCVADFDGAIAAQFDSKPEATLFHVFVLGKNGELLKQWNDVPSAEELGDALKH